MGRRRGPRLRKGLPRGGLGWLGWLPALTALGCACLTRADVATVVSFLVVPVCVWCALGLRRDDQMGEISDFCVDEESWDLKELLSGNFEHPVRRGSNGMIFLAVVACGIACCRWLFGWGPVA
jgi:hypothetical protein